MKKITWLLIFALCLAMLAGCGSSSTDETAEAESETAEAAEEAEEESEEESDEETADAEEAETAESEAAESETAESETAEAGSGTISYPLDTDSTFTIIINPNGLIASIMDDSGFTSSVAYSAMEEATGVTLEWTLYSEATFSEQFTLLLAGGDYPDLFDCGVSSRYPTGVTGLLEDEVVIELSSYLEEYAPDYLELLNSNDGFAESIIQQDGSIIEFATATSTMVEKGLMIRQDWLDELGLETPTTMDELTDVLVAFKTAYDIPMSLLVYAGLDTGLTYAYNIDNRGFANAGMGWVVEDDVVSCTFVTDSFRDYMELLNTYYNLGLFNDDFVNVSDELNTVESTYLSGECGVFYAGVNALSETQQASATDPDYRISALADIRLSADDDGISGVTEQTYTGVNSISISTQCSDVETAIMFCNYFYTEEGQMLANWGIEDVTYTLDEDGEPEYTELVTSDEDCYMYMITLTKYALYWAPTVFDTSLSMASYDDTQLAAVEMWTASRDSYMLIPKNATATDEEQEIENQYGADVATYLWENIFKIVTGQKSLDEYDEVLENAYAMGLTELTESKQSCYDRYLEEHG